MQDQMSDGKCFKCRTGNAGTTPGRWLLYLLAGNLIMLILGRRNARECEMLLAEKCDCCAFKEPQYNTIQCYSAQSYNKNKADGALRGQ